MTWKSISSAQSAPGDPNLHVQLFPGYPLCCLNISLHSTQNISASPLSPSCYPSVPCCSKWHYHSTHHLSKEHQIYSWNRPFLHNQWSLSTNRYFSERLDASQIHPLVLMSPYLDHSSHLLTVLPIAGAVFPKSTLNLNLLLTSFALRLKTITLIEAHKCLQGPLPPPLPDSLSTVSPPSSSQTHWSCASSPSNMPYSLASQSFSMPFPFLECSLLPLCLGYSQSLRPHLLGERTLPCPQMLSPVPLYPNLSFSTSPFLSFQLCLPLWGHLISMLHLSISLKAACQRDPCLFSLSLPLWCPAQGLGCRRHGSRARHTQTRRKLHSACHKDHQTVFLKHQSTNIASLKWLIIYEGTFLGIR